MPEHFPSILFATVGALCAVLALAEWSTRRRLAAVAAAIAAFAAICFAVNHAWSRYSIRVDLLLTIPLVSLAALIVGAMSIRRSPMAARIVGLILVVEGAISFGWFAWSFERSLADSRRVMAIFDEGSHLYWNETVRCEANFEKRFGRLQSSAQPCYGDMVVTSRSPGAYPYTRVVVNDDAKAYLLFSPHTGMETTIGLREGPLAQLDRTSEGGLSGEGDVGFGRTQIRLRPAALESCEATITRGGVISILGLERKKLPLCEDPPNPPIRYVGAWGAIRPGSGSPTTERRLIQIWLWDAARQARGVLLHDLAPSGMRRDFVFARQFRGAQSAPNRWNVRLVDDSDGREGASLNIVLSNGTARISGPQEIFGPGREAILDPGAVVTDPRIELVPVRDHALFERYVDNALFEINIPWTAP
jgi:hypothetical protein